MNFGQTSKQCCRMKYYCKKKIENNTYLIILIIRLLYWAQSYCSFIILCNLCDATFASTSGLHLHKKTSHEKVRYQCPLCNLKFGFFFVGVLYVRFLRNFKIRIFKFENIKSKFFFGPITLTQKSHIATHCNNKHNVAIERKNIKEVLQK